MSIQDERELRERLAGLLDGVTPHPAPVASAVRRGVTIRVRRWISAAAALAVIAAGATIAPALLHGHPASPATKTPRYQVRVQPVGSKAVHGVVAAGVTNGKHWKVILSGSGQNEDLQVTGPVGLGLGSYLGAPGPNGGLVGTEGGSAKNFAYIAGTVGANVASVTVSLPNGEVLSLAPALWHKQRWIGLVLPADVPIVRAVAYNRQGRELAYSVPFGDTDLAAWWAPGQAGPAPVSRTVGAGVVDGHRWEIKADFGPWGYCYTWPGGNDCSDYTGNPEALSRGTLIAPVECGPLDGTSNFGGVITGVVTVARGVGVVVLKYSDGSHGSFPSAEVSGGRSLGYAIPEHVNVVGSVEYSPAGHAVGATNGTPWNCGSS